MIAFQVTINGVPFGTCGFDDWAILNSIITASRAKHPDESDDLFIQVGGLAEAAEVGRNDHVRFIRQDLKVDDEIRIRIVESDKVTSPLKRYRSDSNVQEQPFTEAEILEFEKADYERLKMKFAPKA